MQNQSIRLQREDWGPRFWFILHTLAECSGNQGNKILQNDEADAWVILIKAQAHVMPCKLCKEHFLQWIIKKRLDGLRTLQGENRREFLRGWVWGCHDNVNTMNHKLGPCLEECSSLYPKQSIGPALAELQTMFQVACTKQLLQVDAVQAWKKACHRLRLLYGV